MEMESAIQLQEVGKKEFIRDAAIRLLSAYLIEDRLAWMKDPSVFGTCTDEMVELSVSVSEALWDELQKRGHCCR